MKQPPEPTTTTAWLYLRVSTKRQAEKVGEPEGFSLPVQRTVCAQKAGALDAVVTQEYVDRGETGRKADRPELQRLLRDLSDRTPPTYIIVYKVDRWARDTIDGVLLLQELRNHGVKLISAGENIEDTPEGRLVLTIMLGTAEYESTGKATRIRDNMRRASERGVTMGKAPVGYTNVRNYRDGVESKGVEIDPQRAPWFAGRLTPMPRATGHCGASPTSSNQEASPHHPPPSGAISHYRSTPSTACCATPTTSASFASKVPGTRVGRNL